LVVLATQTAVAVEDARLYDETERRGGELQRLQVLEERELGKSCGTVRSSRSSPSGYTSKRWPQRRTTKPARSLEGVVEDVDHAIRDLRNYIFGLRPGSSPTPSSIRRSRRWRASSGTAPERERVLRATFPS
jgi:hypothetical protein